MKILQVHLSSINFCQTLAGYSSTCSKNLPGKRAEAPIRHPEQHPQAGEECPEWEHLFLGCSTGVDCPSVTKSKAAELFMIEPLQYLQS